MERRDKIELMAHLMRRVGFGATRTELEALAARDYRDVVEELLDPEGHGIPPLDEDICFRHVNTSIPGASALLGAQANILFHMINTERPLEEKMALFWHHVFATGESKVESSWDTLNQIDMFRKLGMGNYRTLLLELARDPAMIYWLDNNENHKDRPNENWGRELLELFSMGVGNYTEKDVFECARAFTGWTISRKIPRLPYGYHPWAFEYNSSDHDDEEKVFLGHHGRFNGEDIIDIVVRQPATARFIARHLYSFFVADEAQVPAWQDTPPRDPVTINALGDAFVSSGYDIRYTLRVLFNSDSFKNARFSKVRSPVEVIVGTLKLVGDLKGVPRLDLLGIGAETTAMGQSVLDPPSVEGWHTGAEWIDSGSLVRRINFVADRVSDLRMPGVQDIVGRIRSCGTINPERLVEESLDLMGPLHVKDETHQELLVHAQRGGDLTWEANGDGETSAARVAEMLGLIAASKEYQTG